MKITKCDRCGIEVQGKSYYSIKMIDYAMSKDFDLCEKCKNLFIDDFMRGGWVVNDQTTL